MPPRPPSVLTIAGSDSGGGAGIQADLKTFSAHAVHSSSVITALTAQNTQGVQDIHIPPLQIIESQLNSVLSDYDFKAIKTGMIPSAQILDIINIRVPNHIPFIVDPVMIATSGDHLTTKTDGWFDSLSRLLSRSHLVTPNVFEAAELALQPKLYQASAEELARKIAEIHQVKHVLVKGGHSEENNAQNAVVDVLYADGIIEKFSKERIESQNTHGTGCTLSSAITANIAKGYTIQHSVAKAKDYVHSAIVRGYAPGRGKIGVLEFSDT